MDHSTSSFLCGYAAYLDLFFCAKEEDDQKEKDALGVGFFCLDGDDWIKFATTFNWPHVAVASIKPGGGDRVVLSVGSQGDYYECLAGTSTERTGVIPGAGPFLARNLAVVDDTVFAVGMGRVVARWDGPGTWTRLDPAAPLPDGQACGFNDLAGPSLKEMYAVGWRGEIWQTDGAAWRQIASPLSDHLRAACTLPNGFIFAVGYNGVMVRGRNDAWNIVDSGRAETLLDVCCFDGKVFVATAYQILSLDDSGLVPVTEFEDPDDMPATCGGLYLAHDGSGVFSLGPKDLFRLRDGLWERLV